LGPFGEEFNFVPVAGIETRYPGHPLHILVTHYTELGDCCTVSSGALAGLGEQLSGSPKNWIIYERSGCNVCEEGQVLRHFAAEGGACWCAVVGTSSS